MTNIVLPILLILALPTADQENSNRLRGRVVDEAGQPVAGVVVSPYWGANGTHKKPDGSAYDLTDSEELRSFWGPLGRMEPLGNRITETAADGSFSIDLGRAGHHVLVMDRERKRGGFGFLQDDNEGREIEVVVQPLVRLRGRMELAEGGQADWTNIYTMLPKNPRRPIDSTRFVHCGSFDSKFEMWLPPGQYRFDAYGNSDAEADCIDVRVIDPPEVSLSLDQPEVDLGTLILTREPTQEEQLAKLQGEGHAGNYREHYGKRPPRIEAVAGRGVADDAQPWSFPGKWVLLDFWGFSCRICLRDLPELIRFYEATADKRDRFEILSVCIDIEGKIKTLDDFEARLQPLIDHVWKGKDLPFPVLLDPSYKTWANYSLEGFPTILLIDPEGNLVEGDLATLSQKIR
ncbi:hypothetical protein BH23PLA1_BH23PLA1_40380 [soil metagenome]